VFDLALSMVVNRLEISHAVSTAINSIIATEEKKIEIVKGKGE
jgi:hypothetical protein